MKCETLVKVVPYLPPLDGQRWLYAEDVSCLVHRKTNSKNESDSDSDSERECVRVYAQVGKVRQKAHAEEVCKA